MSLPLPLLSNTATAESVLSLSGSVWQVPLRPGWLRRRVLIVGSGKESRSLAQYLDQHRFPGYFVRGFLHDGALPGNELKNGVLGTVEDLSRIALAEFVDEVILAGPCDRDLVARVVMEARRVRVGVRVIPDLFGLDPKRVAVDRLGDLPVLKLHDQPVPVLGMFLKRVIDLVASVAALALLTPLFVAIALLIVTASGWPVFYRGRRVGRKGKSFLCCKFRTMVAGADSQRTQLRRHNERQGPLFKISNDPRVTRVGRWLRRYSVDELPQLWNVLRGEMSLVGPRPHPVDDFERYDLEHMRRLEVRPGMTGLWQVTARNDPSFRRNMELDLQYIERWNLWVDARILCKTIAAVLQGSGT